LELRLDQHNFLRAIFQVAHLEQFGIVNVAIALGAEKFSTLGFFPLLTDVIIHSLKVRVVIWVLNKLEPFET